MSRTVEWTDLARSDIKRLDQGSQKRLLDTIHRFAETGHGDIRKLHGVENEYRLRLGNWRVLFAFTSAGTIRILRVLPRGSAYR